MDPETAEATYGKRGAGESVPSEEIPKPVITAGVSADVLEQVLEEMGDMKEQIEGEMANNSGEYTEEEMAKLEEMLEVLNKAEGKLEADLESGNIGGYVVVIDPVDLLEVLGQLEEQINGEIASGNYSEEEIGQMEQVLASVGGLEASIEATMTAGAPGKGSNKDIAVLDEQLEESMGEFDGMILSERAAAQVGAGELDNEEDVAYSGDGSDLFETGDLSESSEMPGMPGQEGSDAGQEGAYADAGGEQGAQGKVAQGVPAGQTVAHGTVPEDVADGSDDDIVARQIREAAMKETDPELRDKLWDEYRRYKNKSKK